MPDQEPNPVDLLALLHSDDIKEHVIYPPDRDLEDWKAGRDKPFRDNY
jgi:hypothetical protein